MKITEEIIKSVNDKCPYNQGIFVEPYCIPTHIKEPVIYSRYETGGVSGGSCWDDSNPQPYEKDAPKDKMKVLEILLKEVKPNITFLQFRELIDKYLHTKEETEYEYYGNSTDYMIEYIKLSDFEEYINSLD